MQRIGIFADIRLGHVPQLFLENGTCVEDFLFREIDEDVGLGVRWSQIKAAHISVLEFKLPRIGLRRQHQRDLGIGGLVLPKSFYRAYPVIFEVLGGDIDGHNLRTYALPVAVTAGPLWIR